MSRICAGLDGKVATFPDRDLSPVELPYVCLDATYGKTRVNHRIVSQAVVVALRVAADGRREVPGFDLGDTENEPFWTAFLRSLKTQGLTGVKLVMSDACTGLKKGSQDMVASIIRTIFVQPDKEHVLTQFDEATRMLTRSHPKVALMLEDARGDALAFTGFPRRHWRQTWSTRPPERVNKETTRRTDIVGVSSH